MKKGFTLVELSIVLVIIGLLTGGILAGRSLILSSTIQATIKEVEQYTVIIKQYKQLNGYWPGDDKNVPGSANGDGYVYAAYESLLSWQHMSDADMLGRKYSIGDGATAVINSNVPSSKVSNTAYVDFSSNIIPNVNAYPGCATESQAVTFPPTIKIRSNADQLGRSGTGGQIGTMKGNFAQAIDRKIDDGLGARGNVRAFGRDTTLTGRGTYYTPCLNQCSTGDYLNPGDGIVKCGLMFTVDED